VLPAQLVEEVEALRKEGMEVELSEEGDWANIVIQDSPLAHGFNKKTTTLLLKFPLGYPNARPELFWTDRDLTLADGSVPASAEVFEQHLGREWRRFSWHPSSWNPGVDNLRTYLEFVNNRLAKRQ
jgi:Prokaryotic E2 family E